MDYGYYIQYHNMKKLANTNKRTLLFALRFCLKYDENEALHIYDAVSRGVSVDPDLIRDPEKF